MTHFFVGPAVGGPCFFARFTLTTLKRNVLQQLARKKTAVYLHSCQSVVGVCVLSKCKESHRSTAGAGEPIPRDLLRSNGLIAELRAQSGTVKTRKHFNTENALVFFRFNYNIRPLLNLLYRQNLQSVIFRSFYDYMMPKDSADPFECQAKGCGKKR